MVDRYILAVFTAFIFPISWFNTVMYWAHVLLGELKLSWKFRYNPFQLTWNV